MKHWVGMQLMMEMPLPGQAATAAFCPQTGSTQLLAVGTYELDEASGLRNGTTEVLRVRPGPEGSCTADTIASLPSAGVFELVWDHCQSQQAVLGTALSDGSISLRPVADSHDSQQDSASACVFGDGALCTNMCFDHETASRAVAAVSSAGEAATLSQVQLVDLRLALAKSRYNTDVHWCTSQLQDGLVQITSWHAHDAEIWACTYSHSQVRLQGLPACIPVHCHLFPARPYETCTGSLACSSRAETILP